MSETTAGQAPLEPWRATWDAWRVEGGFGPAPETGDAEIDGRWRKAWTAAARAAQQPLRDQFAALATQMHAEADAAHYAIEAAALHECASRIRLALGPDAAREALEGK